MAERVLLRHPKHGGTWECPAAAVDAWIAIGWRRATPEKSVSARRRGANAQEMSND